MAADFNWVINGKNHIVCYPACFLKQNSKEQTAINQLFGCNLPCE